METIQISKVHHGLERTPTLWQADGLCDLEPINSTEVPTWMQRDDPWPVLYVAVLGSHPGALDVDVHGAMTHSGPTWGKEKVLD